MSERPGGAPLAAAAPQKGNAWEHALVPLAPVEIAPLQRRYIGSLPVPTLTDLDLRLREQLRGVGVKVEGEAVAFALIRPDPGPTLPGPLLLSLAAPGQNSSELRQFFREVVRQERVQALWGRSDDAMLLEVVLLEGWKLLSQGPLLILDAVETQEVVPGIEVRHLLPSDLDDVGRLMAGIPEAPEELRDRDELRKQLQDRILDGVLVDQKLVGVARLMPQHHPAYVGLDVHILPSHRQRGLGRLLGIEVAHDELNAGRVLVSAFRSEEVARRRLVESMGRRWLRCITWPFRRGGWGPVRVSVPPAPAAIRASYRRARGTQCVRCRRRLGGATAEGRRESRSIRTMFHPPGFQPCASGSIERSVRRWWMTAETSAPGEPGRSSGCAGSIEVPVRPARSP